MCKLILPEEKMDVYELNDDTEKFKNMVSLLDTNVDIFNPHILAQNLLIIQAFEKHFPKAYKIENSAELGKKTIIYTGLKKVKEVYDKRKNDLVKNTGEVKLQAILVESSILSKKIKLIKI